MTRRTVIACTISLALVAAPVVASATTTDYEPGAVGIGDPYVPNEGNGGYRVDRYNIDLTFDPATDRIQATTVVRAKATQNLSRMNFDLFGLKVTSVTVDGQPAVTSRAPRELIVKPATGIDDGSNFVVRVHYQGQPRKLNDPDLGLSGWFNTEDGAIVVGEPEAGMFWFPVNEHPSDKAYIKVSATVPEGLMAVSNGLPATKPQTSGGWTTYRWSSEHPMASYLATIAIGKFRSDRSRTNSGVPVLNYIDRSFDKSVDRSLNNADEVIDYFETRFGRYPFEAAGGIADNYQSYYALENQTRPTYDKATIRWGGLTLTVAHELAHQWYGDSVALKQWRDIWLNEGFATYAEWLWLAHNDRASVKETFERFYSIPKRSRFWNLVVKDPTYAHMFNAPIYYRGAMTLQALRMKVGTHDFFKIMRTWAREHRDGNATTRQFRALSERVSGEPLGGLFHQWLGVPDKPALPRS